MKTIAVLITCHDRKEKTLECLYALYNAQKYLTGLNFDIHLVDDGCIDGTNEAVRLKYPLVNIVIGNGSLFWNRGMLLAWDTATKEKDYDYYLWLNDDSYLFEDGLVEMMSCVNEKNDESIICGFLCSQNNLSKTTYGGGNNGMLLSPNGHLQQIGLMNGNVVLIPKYVYKILGKLDSTFPHAIGDLDYGLRAIKKGINIFSSRIYVATCENNPQLPKWCLHTTPFFERVRHLYSPLGYSQPIYFFIYEKRHFGLFVALKHFTSIHLRVIFPRLWT